jgi:hypothetical protein
MSDHGLFRVLIAFLLTAAPALAAPPAWDVWTADPLIKIFRDDLPPTAAAAATPQASDDVARGQTATFQLVLRSDAPLTGVRCSVTPFTIDGATADPLDTRPRARFVGYIPVPAKDMGHPATDRPRAVPADYPDPLLPDAVRDVPGNTTQPLWVTARVPVDAPPGAYRATATLHATAADGQALRTDVPLTLTVHPAAVRSVRLWNSNYFHLFHGYGWDPMPAHFSPGYWTLYRTFIRNMVEHRQNTFRVVPLLMSQFSWDQGGKLRVDFSRLDQAIHIIREEGGRRFEGQQIGWRKDKWESPFVVSVFVPPGDPATKVPEFNPPIPGHSVNTVDPRWVEVRVPVDSPEADRFYSQFLPQFQAHLESLGLLDAFAQHLGDEPVNENVASHQQIGALVKKYAPRLKRIDARLSEKGTDAVDVLVPLLDAWHKHYDFYRKLQQNGQELWFYTCVNPQYSYANRFIQQPLIKTRLLFWVAFRYGATGHLHWGYNYWAKDADPFKGVRLPSGDANIVYPGPNFTVLDSIRWEAYRDSVEDHELLSQLADKDPAAAQKIADRQIQDFNKYDTDVQSFRATRRELLQALDH